MYVTTAEKNKINKAAMICISVFKRILGINLILGVISILGITLARFKIKCIKEFRLLDFCLYYSTEEDLSDSERVGVMLVALLLCTCMEHIIPMHVYFLQSLSFLVYHILAFGLH